MERLSDAGSIPARSIIKVRRKGDFLAHLLIGYQEGNQNIQKAIV